MMKQSNHLLHNYANLQNIKFYFLCSTKNLLIYENTPCRPPYCHFLVLRILLHPITKQQHFSNDPLVPCYQLLKQVCCPCKVHPWAEVQEFPRESWKEWWLQPANNYKLLSRNDNIEKATHNRNKNIIYIKELAIFKN